jgi:hypothetical protein
VVEEDGAGAAASLSLSDEGEEEEAPGRLEQKEEKGGRGLLSLSREVRWGREPRVSTI